MPTPWRFAQPTEFGLIEAPGPVPVLYVPSAKEQALHGQKALARAHAWFEEKLKVHPPMALVVLDEETWKKTESAAYPFPMPHSAGNRLVIATTKEDPEEYVLFHEDGRRFAAALGIGSGNRSIGALIASLFASAYIQSQRPDLAPTLHQKMDKRPAPRYTSLEDLDTLNTMDQFNYYWYEDELLNLALVLLDGQDFAGVVERLKKEFPSANRKHETFAEIEAHLKAIQPGLKVAGPLGGPHRTGSRERQAVPQGQPRHSQEDRRGAAPHAGLDSRRSRARSGSTAPGASRGSASGA